MRMTLGELRQVIKEEVMRSLQEAGNVKYGGASSMRKENPWDALPKGKPRGLPGPKDMTPRSYQAPVFEENEADLKLAQDLAEKIPGFSREDIVTKSNGYYLENVPTQTNWGTRNLDYMWYPDGRGGFFRSDIGGYTMTHLNYEYILAK